ncbi:hypothetical protein Goshw_017193 [Gossypium schwendimanii]|uniref:RNase H type-1 domain-containing protein n=1 Tax=Gossypium schwendimanii TaxID=34291 RepID=A0A7J9N1F3_GOSSC|nr:hypothetical protein [Gossypium schwendimanii]
MVKERLDRFLMSTDAFNDFPFIATNVLRKANSDDDVIMLDTMRQKPKENTKDPRLSFKFDACWVKDMEAKDIIKRTWNKEDTNIVDKMENVRESLGPWQHNKYRNMVNNIRRLMIALMHQLADRECFKCGEKRQTLVHVIKEYPNARVVLTAGVGTIEIMLLKGKEEVAWAIWKRAKIFSKEFCIHNMMNKPILLPQMVEKKWEKPPIDKVKVNFDVVMSNGKIGFGVLAHDDEGFVVGGSYGFRVENM